MPTYVYECPRCGHNEEMQQSIKDDYRPKCPNPGCGDETMERVIQTTSFSLKGVGWARDGYDKVMK